MYNILNLWPHKIQYHYQQRLIERFTLAVSDRTQWRHHRTTLRYLWLVRKFVVIGNDTVLDLVTAIFCLCTAKSGVSRACLPKFFYWNLFMAKVREYFHIGVYVKALLTFCASKNGRKQQMNGEIQVFEALLTNVTAHGRLCWAQHFQYVHYSKQGLVLTFCPTFAKRLSIFSLFKLSYSACRLLALCVTKSNNFSISI